MPVYHVRIESATDAAARRPAHRERHIARLAELRALGAFVGGGPSPDAATAELVWSLQREDQLQPAMEEDPYWTGGVWRAWQSRRFAEFIEPWTAAPIVLDGSRPAVVVEGRTTDLAMAQVVLVDLRGSGRLAFGGVAADGITWGLFPGAAEQDALAWIGETGFWEPASLATRPLFWVL